MKENIFIKFLASIPIILLVLYYIPFLGICLLILRYFVYSDKKRTTTPVIILILGIVILVPKIISGILDLANINIPYIDMIITSNLYNINFINFSKLLISVGVIFLILSFIFRKLFNKISHKFNYGIRNFIKENERKNAEILKANDMEMRIKREKARNTNYVRCPYCGSDNIMAEKTGKCKYCRRILINENYHD